MGRDALETEKIIAVDLVGETINPWVEKLIEGLVDRVGEEINGNFVFRERVSGLRERLTEPSWAAEYLLDQYGEEQSRGDDQLFNRVDGLMESILDEMVEGVQAGDAFEMNTQMMFGGEVVQSLWRLVALERALEQGEAVRVVGEGNMSTTMERWSEMQTWATFGKGEVSNYILWQEWTTRVMWQQRGISLEERQEWLEEFLLHVMGELDVNDEVVAEKAYAAPAGLEVERDMIGLRGAWGERQSARKVLVIGPGEATRIDGPLLTKLIEGGVVSHDAVVDGLDLLGEAEVRKGIDVRIGDVREMAEKHPDWRGKKQLIIGSGSALTNMDLARVQAGYWKNLADVADEGAILLLDEAMMEPVSKQNRRVNQTTIMQQDVPSVVGEVPVNSEYWREDVDKPSDVGARIIPLVEKLAMARANGWRCVNLPKIGTGEWWDLMALISDRDELERATLERRDAMETPFYLAGEKEDGLVARATLIFEKIGIDENDDVGMQMINNISALMQKEDPLRVVEEIEE